MRLLLTADQYYPPTLGGSAMATRQLAHGLAGRGHEVTVLAPAERFDDTIEREDGLTVIRCRSVPALHLIHHTDRHRIRVAVLPQARAARAVRELRPDVVHAQLPAYIGAAAAREARRMDVPVVATSHALPDNPFPSRDRDSAAFRLFASVFWHRTIDFCEWADAVSAPSRTAARILYGRGLRREVRIISNGVDVERFRPPLDEAERRQARAALGLPANVPIVLYVGRLATEKRLDVLVDAIAPVRSRVEALFVFCGSGSTTVRRRAEERGVGGHARFLDLVPDELLPLAYQAADVFALPSEAELQGLVLLEAAASGLPVVGARALAIPELVGDGLTGHLFRPGDSADLADALVRLLVDPAARRAMAERARAVALEHAAVRTIERYETLYRELAAAALARSGLGKSEPGPPGEPRLDTFREPADPQVREPER